MEVPATEAMFFRQRKPTQRNCDHRYEIVPKNILIDLIVSFHKLIIIIVK
jgi:hypothetical protein